MTDVPWYCGWTRCIFFPGCHRVTALHKFIANKKSKILKSYSVKPSAIQRHGRWGSMEQTVYSGPIKQKSVTLEAVWQWRLWWGTVLSRVVIRRWVRSIDSSSNFALLQLPQSNLTVQATNPDYNFFRPTWDASMSCWRILTVSSRYSNLLLLPTTVNIGYGNCVLTCWFWSDLSVKFQIELSTCIINTQYFVTPGSTKVRKWYRAQRNRECFQWRRFLCGGRWWRGAGGSNPKRHRFHKRTQREDHPALAQWNDNLDLPTDRFLHNQPPI